MASSAVAEQPGESRITSRPLRSPESRIRPAARAGIENQESLWLGNSFSIVATRGSGIGDGGVAQPGRVPCDGCMRRGDGRTSALSSRVARASAPLTARGPLRFSISSPYL